MKQKTENILQRLMAAACNNGYSIIINGAKDDELQVAVYPFRRTQCPEEDVARQLFDVIEKNGLLEHGEDFEAFKKEAQPDSIRDFVFSGPNDQDIHISVFHNKNILLKQIYMKI